MAVGRTYLLFFPRGLSLCLEGRFDRYFFSFHLCFYDILGHGKNGMLLGELRKGEGSLTVLDVVGGTFLDSASGCTKAC